MRATRFILTGRQVRSSLCAVLLATAACTGEERSPLTAERLDGGRADTADGEMEPAAPPPEPDAATPRFVDAQGYWEVPEEIDAWYQLVADLRRGFDDVCGDTFCEGEFSNHQSLRFRCSVEESSGALGSCVWVIAASNEEIAPETGAVTVDGQVFACAMPIPPATDIRAFVQALSAPGVEPIRAAIPGSDRSLYDGLTECL
jgi:hypothetical protein